MGNIKIMMVKRDLYIEAWKIMYANNKKGFNEPMYDGVNPMLNKTALNTELDNICAVAVDISKDNDVPQNAMDLFGGMPVGIHSMLITRVGHRNGFEGSLKIIGKQWVVDPRYQHQGIGAALLLCLERELIQSGYTWYYIGCSAMSSGIMKKFGQVPYDSSEEHDLYKFNVDLTCKGFDEAFAKHMGFSVNADSADDSKFSVQHVYNLPHLEWHSDNSNQ